MSRSASISQVSMARQYRYFSWRINSISSRRSDMAITSHESGKLDHAAMGNGVLPRADPTQQHRALGVAGRIDEVRDARILGCDDDGYCAVAVVACGALVDPDRQMPVIQRLHPEVVELKVPVLALRNRRVDHQGFIRSDLPVAMQ